MIKCPKKVKRHGKVLAKIYPSEGRRGYRVCWQPVEGRRLMKSFATYGGTKGALQFAEAVVKEIATGPDTARRGAKVNAAMRDIEKHNPQLAGVLPKTYNLFTSALLKELLKKVSEIPPSLDYDAFGGIYESFIIEFAMSERQITGKHVSEILGGKIPSIDLTLLN